MEGTLEMGSLQFFKFSKNSCSRGVNGEDEFVRYFEFFEYRSGSYMRITVPNFCIVSYLLNTPRVLVFRREDLTFFQFPGKLKTRNYTGLPSVGSSFK